MKLNRKPRRVTVLGAGPAGLLAAYAAHRRHYEVVVFSAPDVTSDGNVARSQLYGCQYLHAKLDGLYDGEGKGTMIEYQVHGSSDQYRRKVYGPSWDGGVSLDEYGPEHPHLAWNLRTAYDRLWRWAKSEDILVSCRLMAGNVAPIFNDRNNFVISSIPAPALCLKPGEHKFITQDIWAMGSTDTHQDMPFRAPHNTVVCNGEDAPRWYRAANVFGYSTLEWPGGPKPPIAGVAAVKKPLSTDCDCWTQSKRWMRVGRYGKWQKGVLVHTAHQEVMEALR